MKKIVLVAVMILFSLESCSSTTEDVIFPNIIFFMADDMGLGDVRVYDNTSTIPTPNIDKIAFEGIRFTDAHAPTSVCTPSRYSILTGRYAFRSNLVGRVLRSAYANPLLESGYETLPEFLGRAGYYTAAFGKWHLGMSFTNRAGDGRAIAGVGTSMFTTRDVSFTHAILDGPIDHGFDYFFGIASATNHGPYTFIENDRVTRVPTRLRDEVRVNGKRPFRQGWAAPDWDDTQLGAIIWSNALSFLRTFVKETPEKPFFIYYAATANHWPHFPPAAIANKPVKGMGGNDDGTPDRNDMVVENDVILGELLDFLEDPNGDGNTSDSIVDNTLLIVTSDNGADIGSYGKIRGKKGSIYEGGHRVPFIVRWPSRIKGNQVSSKPVSLIDLYATLAEVIQKEPDPGAAQDSRNILPALVGTAGRDWTRGPVLQQATGLGKLFAIREGEWKLIIQNGKPVELYNISVDSHETNNRISQYPDIVKRLMEIFGHEYIILEKKKHTEI